MICWDHSNNYRLHRLSPAKFDQGKFGAGDESQVDEAGFPLVSINEAANKVSHVDTNFIANYYFGYHLRHFR